MRTRTTSLPQWLLTQCVVRRAARSVLLLGVAVTWACSESAQSKAGRKAGGGVEPPDSMAAPASTRPAELTKPLAEYVSAQEGHLFWTTYEPLSVPVTDGATGWGGWRTRLERKCRKADGTMIRCRARARAHAASYTYDFRNLPTNGVIAAFFQLTQGEGNDAGYGLSKFAKGYFLILTRDPADTDNTKARWQLVGVGPNHQLIVYPSTGYGSLKACDGHHTPTFAAAGFEPCAFKHANLSAIGASMAGSQITGLSGLNAYEASISLGEALEAQMGPDDLMWTTCHLGCCRAEGFRATDNLLQAFSADSASE